MYLWRIRSMVENMGRLLTVNSFTIFFLFSQRQSMDSLIELLQTSNMEPSERKTSFLQLNILTQDPELTEIFHSSNGLYLCLEALQNALKVSRAFKQFSFTLIWLQNLVQGKPIHWLPWQCHSSDRNTCKDVPSATWLSTRISPRHRHLLHATSSAANISPTFCAKKRLQYRSLHSCIRWIFTGIVQRITTQSVFEIESSIRMRISLEREPIQSEKSHWESAAEYSKWSVEWSLVERNRRIGHWKIADISKIENNVAVRTIAIRQPMVRWHRSHFHWFHMQCWQRSVGDLFIRR